MNEVFQMPAWAMLLGPMIGLFINFLKNQEKLAGFGLLFASIFISAALICTFGLYQGWHGVEWRQVPFVLFMMVGTSVLTGSTVEHALSK